MQQEAELDLILNRFYIISLKENATKGFKHWLRKKYLANADAIKDKQRTMQKLAQADEI